MSHEYRLDICKYVDNRKTNISLGLRLLFIFAKSLSMLNPFVIHKEKKNRVGSQSLLSEWVPGPPIIHRRIILISVSSPQTMYITCLGDIYAYCYIDIG